MKKLNLIFLICLMIISGCKRKKVVQERLCSRIDLEQIVSLIPKNSNDIDLLVEQTKQLMDAMFVKIDQIAPEQRTYLNTLLEYEKAYFQFFTNQQILHVLAQLSQDSGMQTAANVGLLDLSQYAAAKLTRNMALSQAFHEYSQLGKDPYRHIKPVTFFLNYMLHDFVRQGMQLSVAQRTDIARMEQEVQQIAGRFYNNASYDHRHIVVSAQELVGVPAEFLQTLSKDAANNYILSVDMQTFFTIMENCLVESTRRSYYLMFGQCGYPQNKSVLQQLQQKRNELAQALGFDSFASYQLDSLMIKTPKKADAFLWSMVKELQPYDDRDFVQLIRQLPPSVELTSHKQLKPWDEALVKSWYRKHHFNINDYEIAQYFPLEHVLPVMLKQLGQFFRIAFEPQPVDTLWASDLSCYRVRSLKHQAVIGYIFFDLYKRASKRDNGEYQLTMIPAIRDDCSIPCVGAAIVVANFAHVAQTVQSPTEQTLNIPLAEQSSTEGSSTEGSSTEGSSTEGSSTERSSTGQILLEFNDVISLLHETGHALHAIFGATRFTQFSGTQVMHDFVETPSQMLEYWFDEPEFLRALSHHCQTGQPMNTQMIEQLIAAQKFGRVSRMLKQLFLGLVSLHLFGKDQENSHLMIEKLYKEVFKHVAYEPENYFEMSFMHLAQQHYAAAYYTYPWSQVIAADLFAHVKQHGIFNPETGSQFITEILSPGGSRHPQEMLKRFLGRSFQKKSFLEQL